MEIKINHQKNTFKDGAVYQRGFNVTLPILKGFLRYLGFMKNRFKYPKKMFLNAELGLNEFEKETIYTMNLSQTDLFIDYMRKHGIKFNPKRANLKVNGYLILK